ncbi:RNA polymerase sigma factor [Streptomyces tendae]|uniref:RNA polymerase sigma factor n=1 Tax=Streptomyces tendae TaxID=1932 RepID=UPI0037B5CE7C
MTHAQHFREVYEECYPRVLAYTTSLVGRQVGEDITSETFAVAWRRVGDIAQPPLPWLLGVARNLVRELRRRDSRQYALAAAEAQRISSGARADAGDIAADVTDRQAALQALASLSDTDRELLTLVAWHGLNAKEAARVLGCTTATLTVRLHRARRRLEKALESAFQADTTPVPAPNRAHVRAAAPVPASGAVRKTESAPLSPAPRRPADRKGALT